MIRKIGAVIILLNALCFGETNLELRVSDPIGEIEKVDKANIDFKVIGDIGDISLSGIAYNGKLTGRNNIANACVAYDNGGIAAGMVFERKYSNIGFFADKTLLFSEALMKFPREHHIFIPKGTVRYYSDDKESYINSGIGVEYNYIIVDKTVGVITTENIINTNREDCNYQEAGVKSKILVDLFNIEPSIFVGHEHTDNATGEEYYIKSDIKAKYSIMDNLAVEAGNYNVMSLGNSNRYVTQKLAVSGMFDYADAKLGKEQVALNVSYNQKGIYDFKRAVLYGNKYIGNFEGELEMSYRESEVRTVMGYNVKCNYYITEMNKVFFGVSKDNVTKYVVSASTNDVLEIGIVSIF